MSIARLLWGLGGILMLAPSAPSAQTLPAREIQDQINIAVTIESDRVRFTTRAALEWRLEIVDPQGQPTFDSGAVNDTTIDWPLVDGQGQPVKSGLYQYALTLRAPGAEPRIQRGHVQLDRLRSVYEIRALSNDMSDTGLVLNVVESGLNQAATSTAVATDSIANTLPTSLGTVRLTGTSYISGIGTTNYVTKWADGPNGVIGDAQMSEYAGALTIGNGSFKGNLHIFGSEGSDVFAGMGPNLVTGPAFNFGYAGGSLGRSVGFFNVRPDASAIAPNPSLRFLTANVQRMIITNTGNVGIGTTSPAHRLHVESASGPAVVGSSSGATGMIGITDSNYGVWGYGGLSGGSGVLGTSSSNEGVRGVSVSGTGVHGVSNSSYGVRGTSASLVGVYGSSSSNFGVHGDSTSSYGVVGSSDSSRGVYGVSDTGVGVYGVSVGNYAGYFNGSVYVTGTVTQNSDLRLKRDVAKLAYGLREVLRLRPVTWTWKDRPDRGHQLGLIAQEVEPVIPELVTQSKDEPQTLGLNYIGLVPVLIKAIQEQHTENSALQARVAALEQKLDELLRQLSRSALANGHHETERSGRARYLDATATASPRRD